MHRLWTLLLSFVLSVSLTGWKAVQLNIPEKNPNARYRNPHITVNESIRANQQHSNS